MPPYQQQPAPVPQMQPPGNPNPYDFILNPQQPKKKGRLEGSMTRMVVLIVGAAVAVMIVVGVGISLLTGGKASNAEQLVTLAQIQYELLRVSNQGTTDATQQATKNLAVTAEYTLRTQERATVAFLAAHGRKIADKEITLKQNAQTDQAFAAAKTTSTFDQVFTQTMQGHLTDYASALKTVFNNATNPAERDMLSGYYEQTQLLISQVPYTQDSLGQ